MIKIEPTRQNWASVTPPNISWVVRIYYYSYFVEINKCLQIERNLWNDSIIFIYFIFEVVFWVKELNNNYVICLGLSLNSFILVETILPYHLIRKVANINKKQILLQQKKIMKITKEVVYIMKHCMMLMTLKQDSKSTTGPNNIWRQALK